MSSQGELQRRLQRLELRFGANHWENGVPKNDVLRLVDEAKQEIYQAISEARLHQDYWSIIATTKKWFGDNPK